MVVGTTGCGNIGYGNIGLWEHIGCFLWEQGLVRTKVCGYIGMFLFMPEPRGTNWYLPKPPRTMKKPPETFG